MIRSLQGLGILDENEALKAPLGEADPDEQLLLGLRQASVHGLIATGERAGQRVERRGGLPFPALGEESEGPQIRGRRCASYRGFSLHADVAVGGKSRTRLEHLFRYVARGPLSNERLSLREDGKLELRLKTPWRDGTNAVLFTAHEMIEKLIAIIPPPRFNQVRYHGVFAPTHRWRQHVINDRRPPYAPPKADPDAEKYAAAVPRRGRNYSWAELMRRVWDADVLECERCQGSMRVIAALTTPEPIRAVLGALGMPTEPPVVAPREAPQSPSSTGTGSHAGRRSRLRAGASVLGLRQGVAWLPCTRDSDRVG